MTTFVSPHARTTTLTDTRTEAQTYRGRVRTNPARIAERLAGQLELWQPHVDFDPDQRFYTRIAETPDFEAWLLTWLPGQHTEWHDHGGSAGAFTVLQGVLHEQTAEYDPVRPPRILDEVRTLPSSSVRGFGRHHIHRVSNDGPDPAISLHVYAPALLEMTDYQVYGDLLDVIEHRRIGADW